MSPGSRADSVHRGWRAAGMLASTSRVMPQLFRWNANARRVSIERWGM
jgi:hypothetical protein